ncbi:complex III assembly factor LYRM7, partial [Paragonimus westermani]
MQRAHALKVFRDLHRTCRLVFDGDVPTFKAAKDRIRAEFRANQMERDPQKIAEVGLFGFLSSKINTAPR